MVLYHYTNTSVRVPTSTEELRMRKLKVIALEGNKHLTAPQRKRYEWRDDHSPEKGAAVTNKGNMKPHVSGSQSEEFVI